MMHRPDPARLDALFQAIHDSVGLCRLEAVTFRTVGLAIPAIRAAAEDLMGGSLLQEGLYRSERGILCGRLTKETYRMFSNGAMRSVWPALTKDWNIGLCTDANWIVFVRAGEPVPERLPPRIDHLTDARLPHAGIPVDGGWLLPGIARSLGREGPWESHRRLTGL